MLHSKRLANWDLLRSLAMFFVVIVHCLATLGQVHGVEVKPWVSDFFLICDPVFFCLSGYFAIRPLKTGLATYYLRKVSAIIIPIVVYSLLLFAWNVVTGGLPDPSLQSLASYQLSLLTGFWWFMPELIPFLIVAPFLSTMFDALSDKQLVTIALVVGVLGGWGCASTFATNVLDAAGMTTGSTLFAVAMQLLPASVIPGSRYFVFFVMGYFVRRMSPKIQGRTLRGLCLLGLATWVLGSALRGLGFERPDPSYYWLYTTLAIFLLFDRLRIIGPRVSRVLAWTAKRSYSIYLVQYTTIAVIQPLLYESGAFGDVAALTAAARVGVWCLLVVLAYLLALGVASVLDPTVVRFFQWGWTKLAVEPSLRRRA